MRKLFGAIALLGALVAVQVGPAQAGNSQGRNQHSKLVTTDGQVVVRRGEPVQLAAVLDTSTGAGAAYTQSIHNAIEMAVQLSPAIRGFRIELNDDFDGPCGDGPGVVGQNADAASSVVANAQNVAVIGHMCS